MTVALLVTCLTDTFYPRVGEAVVRVLRHFGCDVAFPEHQTCCGQPAFNSGFRAEAAAVAEHMIAVFEPYESIVTPSASCAAMLQRCIPDLFHDDARLRDAARRLGGRTHEFSVFLREHLHVDIGSSLRLDGRTTFHYPCHARHVYSLSDLASSLASAQAAAIAPPARPEECCGFGGMFAVDFPEISGAMLSAKLDDLAATGARTVICNEGGCTLNLSGGAHRRSGPSAELRFVHVAELLAESLGLMEPMP